MQATQTTQITLDNTIKRHMACISPLEAPTEEELIKLIRHNQAKTFVRY